MSLRVPLLLFQNYCKISSLSNFHLHGAFACSQRYISAVSTQDPPKECSEGHLEVIQVSKHLQPLMNHPVDKVLSLVDAKSTSASDAVAVLKKLRISTLFGKADAASFKSTNEFKILCNIFEKKCPEMEPNLLVSGLRSLLEVGEPPTTLWVIKAEQLIIKNIDQFTIFNLIGCLYFHWKFTETALQTQVVSLLVKEIQERISEVSSNSETLMLVRILNVFKGETRKIVEQKILELVPLLNVDEMCKVIVALAESSIRNIVLLNVVTFHLRQREEKPDIKVTVDLLYAFHKLNFIDTVLFTHLLHRTIPKIPAVQQPALISRILSTCGHLRFRHAGTLDACGDWILAQGASCGTRELAAYVLSVASLNHRTPHTNKVLHSILPHLSYEKVQSLDVWLDVVWSLAVLNVTNQQILEKMLSAEFCQPLIDGSDFKAISNKLKLMNLKMVLKINYPECIFGCDLFLEHAEVSESAKIRNSRRHVIKVLSNFVPGEKYLCSSQNTDMGILIDAEFIMDKKCKPLPLSVYGLKAKAIDVPKALPTGARRIALLVFFHKDFILNGASLTGSNALAIELLSAQGYKVVQISFAEFVKNGTEVKKAEYLLENVKDALK